jgi:hypothetical protein
MAREVLTDLHTAALESMRPLPEPFNPRDRRPDGSPWGSIYWRDLGNGREIVVFPLLFGMAKLGEGPLGECYMDTFYEYGNAILAMAAAVTWDGVSDPRMNWERSSDGRCRPDGNPAKEYVRD